MTATVTLRWDDPEDAAQFLELHGELCRQGWLPDPSADALRELTASATAVRKDDGDDPR